MIAGRTPASMLSPRGDPIPIPAANKLACASDRRFTRTLRVPRCAAATAPNMDAISAQDIRVRSFFRSSVMLRKTPRDAAPLYPSSLELVLVPTRAVDVAVVQLFGRGSEPGPSRKMGSQHTVLRTYRNSLFMCLFAPRMVHITPFRIFEFWTGHVR